MFTSCRPGKLRVRKTLVSQKTNTDYCRKEAGMHINGKVLIKTSVDKKKEKRITLTCSQQYLARVGMQMSWPSWCANHFENVIFTSAAT